MKKTAQGTQEEDFDVQYYSDTELSEVVKDLGYLDMYEKQQISDSFSQYD